jgi:putative transposase
VAQSMSSHGQSPRTPLTHVSDEAWEAVEPLLQQYDPPRRLGRKRIDQRQALDAIVYRLQSGCRWNNLPKEYPDDSSVHRTYQRWQRLGVMEQILQTLGEDATERRNLQ